MSALGLLSWTVSGLAKLSSTLVHPVYFPYPWAPVLHAARISLVFQTLARRNSASWKKTSWGSYIFGYLIACWGGGIATHVAMGLPPPHFFSFHPWINYISVHLALTLLFNIYPHLLVPKIYDTLLFPLDGLLRAHSVVSALSLFLSPSISNPLSGLSQPSPFKSMDTPFGHVLLGALASAGGGIPLSTLSLWADEWKFATPPVLKASIWGSADVWGGALAAVVYSSVTHSAAFSIPPPSQLTAAYFPLTLIPRHVLDFFFKPAIESFSFSTGVTSAMHFTIPFLDSLLGIAATKTTLVEDEPGGDLKLDAPLVYQTVAVPIGPVEAKALAALTLVAVFGARVLVTHWLTPAVSTAENSSTTGKGKAAAKYLKRN